MGRRSNWNRKNRRNSKHYHYSMGKNIENQRPSRSGRRARNMTGSNDNQPLDIRPQEGLEDEARSAVQQWSEAFDSVFFEDEVTIPLQDTIRGIRFKGEEPPFTRTDGPMNNLLDYYYKKRHHAEGLYRFFNATFFDDHRSVENRVTYAPARLLGWWIKNLSDEISWILANGGTLLDPYEHSYSYEQRTITPPAFSERDLTDDGIENICEQTVVLQGRPASDVEYLEHKIWETAKTEEALSGRTYTPEEWSDALSRAITGVLTGHQTVGVVVGIDLETTGLRETRDWVIDAGWLFTDLHDASDHTWGEERRSYGVSETRMLLGNPTEDISGIKTEDLAGLMPLDLDDHAQEEILNALTSGSPFVAHFARFEDKFLCQNVNGYAEARRDGIIKSIDSKNISQWLDDYEGKQGNHLEQYARHWGALDPETDKERHLGLEDSQIMLKAMGRHLRTITPQPDILRSMNSRIDELNEQLKSSIS